MNNPISMVADYLREADRILFITGAGLSADSGLPTYRGVGGLYEEETTEEGIPIEEVLSGTMLKLFPGITWKYLWQIGSACRGATFNRGHEVIAEIEKQKPNTWVMTQNVDGLHHAAGTKNLIELHGRASELHCTKCSYKTTADDLLDGYGGEYHSAPLCPSCGAVIRPDVVLFGEYLPQKAVLGLQHLEAVAPEIVFAVGTSGMFPYIAQPMILARASGIPTVEINPVSTMLSEIAEYRIEDTAAKALDRLWEIVQEQSMEHPIHDRYFN